MSRGEITALSNHWGKAGRVKNGYFQLKAPNGVWGTLCTATKASREARILIERAQSLPGRSHR